MNVHLLRDIRQLLLVKKYDDVDGAMKVQYTHMCIEPPNQGHGSDIGIIN